ncbi:secretin receptor-like isoform X1 [Cataglyphis hispanica]|uniref:secretin receptor-like isoform X1 n=1 Tax=Cataglyphis hispanica TaxID=1086592 RepID=UPI00217F35DB|nr:secretin receptor-like isoform X1 [Cataglyphis hispanica]XP_050454503.1 secretin receptor-like isoform X1 [Cataglyphis hispanica]XP_050454504.1 secretin receptor-like isoform X1 [Cataglyphis hispanica]
METHGNGDIDRIQNLMIEILKSESERCNHGNILEAGWCPEIWDEILCWNSTAPGQLAIQYCPSYIMGFEPHAFASKQCMPNGQWFMNTDHIMWSNYTQCYEERLVTVLVNISDVQANNVTLIKLQKFFPIVKTISKLGYTISLFTLIIAFCILAAINLSPIGRRKLRCSRNMLHMHLFVSFVMRAFMALLKDLLFVSGIGLSDAVIENDEGYWLINEKENNWHCKIFTSLWQYFLLANYSWILMEGIYLHNLIFLALFTDANSSIAVYALFGWGLPAIFILPWVVTRIIYEDTYCWTTNVKPLLFLFIRVPTMLSILINFVLFINIVRVLLIKLKSTMSEETQRYKRWARSTLVLVPLFGVHYAFFIGMSYSVGENETVEIVWLFCDQLFASFQGFFVAVLYCFLNGEVRTEVSRTLRSIKRTHLHGIQWGSRPSTHSVSTCSCNNASKSGGRHSRKPKWWKSRWKTNPCLFHDRAIRQSTHSMASTQDVRTRGCSLASNKEYLEMAGNDQVLQPTMQDQHTHHTSPLCNKYTDQSILSFYSNMSDASGSNIDEIRDQHRWSNSECCYLAYELHKLQQHHGQ